MVWFSSDLHLGHTALIQMCNRPFDSVDEMNNKILQNFNQLVHKKDYLYLLGDLTHRITVVQANELIAKLPGRKILIKGNHDKQYDSGLFEAVYDFKIENFGGKFVAMMHYPMLSWPKSNLGSFMLHGHSHSFERDNMNNREQGIYRYDVGVDANHMRPVSIEQIKHFFEKKETAS